MPLGGEIAIGRRPVEAESSPRTVYRQEKKLDSLTGLFKKIVTGGTEIQR